MAEQRKIELLLPIETYQRIMQYTDVADGEITGFADVVYDSETHKLIAGQVYLLEQEATGADCEMSEETISNFTVECIRNGATQLPRLWWHSHVNMGAFFSTTDDQAMEDLKNDSFSVSLVVNKRREMKCTLRIYEPVDVRIDDIPVRIMFETQTIPDAIIQEVAEKVKQKKQVYIPPTTGKYSKSKQFDFGKSDKSGGNEYEVHKTMKNGKVHYTQSCYDRECLECEQYWADWLENFDKEDKYAD